MRFPVCCFMFEQGKVSDLLKDCGLFGVSLADHAKADFSTVALRTTKVRATFKSWRYKRGMC